MRPILTPEQSAELDRASAERGITVDSLMERAGRAVARAARFEWNKLECRVEGMLDRVERISRFTKFSTFAQLSVPKGADTAKARELLERAEQGCLIANSLVGTRSLQTEVIVTD